MNSSPEPHDSRRQLALGIWSLLALTMVLDVSGITVAESIGITILVSALSLFAYLLDQSTNGRKPRQVGRQELPMAIAVIIPIGWAILLFCGGLTADGFKLFALGLIIIVVASMTGMQRAITPFKIVAAAKKSAGSDAQDEALKTMMAPVEPVANDENSVVRMQLLEGDESEVFTSEMESVAPDVTQWLTRSKNLEREIIEGGVRIEFGEGQRDVTVHLSFCPPFFQIPRIDAEDLDGADLEIRVAATFCFGARLTIRRSASLDSGEHFASYRIGFVAVADSIRRVA